MTDILQKIAFVCVIGWICVWIYNYFKKNKKNKSPKINFRRLMSEFYTSLIIQQYPKKSIGSLDGKKNS